MTNVARNEQKRKERQVLIIVNNMSEIDSHYGKERPWYHKQYLSEELMRWTEESLREYANATDRTSSLLTYFDDMYAVIDIQRKDAA